MLWHESMVLPNFRTPNIDSTFCVRSSNKNLNEMHKLDVYYVAKTK